MLIAGGIVLVMGFGYVILFYTITNIQSVKVSGVAFGLMATITNLTFGYSRAYVGSDKIRAKIVKAGELFLMAMLLFAFASIFRFSLTAIGPDADELGEKTILEILNSATYSFTYNTANIAALVFMLAYGLAFYGLVTLTKALLYKKIRLKPYRIAPSA
jgi:hypothetical protein